MSLILASQSPRRKVLLGFISNDFTVDEPKQEEKVEEGTPAKEMVEQLALKKAKAVSPAHPGDIVIGCDTVVALGEEILGKPKDEQDASRMLHELSGRTHTVYTGVALVQDDREETFVSATDVKFYELEEGLIEWYIGTGEPADKAGAYGIQGNGSLLVESISGDYFTVMGLPVGQLYRRLNEFMASAE